MGHCAAVELRSLYLKWMYTFYRIVAYGVIERLLAIFVIRNKKYKTSTGLLFFEINLTYLLKMYVARDIRYPWPTLFLAVFKYIQQFLSRKDIIDFLKLGFNTSPQHVTDIFIYRAQNFFNTSFTEDKKVFPCLQQWVYELVGDINHAIVFHRKKFRSIAR